MKKTILFLAFIMALISFEALAGVDSLLYEINPSLTQRGGCVCQTGKKPINISILEC